MSLRVDPSMDGQQRLSPDSTPLLDTSELLSGSVISHSGAYEASEEERKLLCLLSDGRLLVASGQWPNAQSACAVVPRATRSDEAATHRCHE